MFQFGHRFTPVRCTWGRVCCAKATLPQSTVATSSVAPNPYDNLTLTDPSRLIAFRRIFHFTILWVELIRTSLLAERPQWALYGDVQQVIWSITDRGAATRSVCSKQHVERCGSGAPIRLRSGAVRLSGRTAWWGVPWGSRRSPGSGHRRSPAARKPSKLCGSSRTGSRHPARR